jgi:hypothetical protein
MVPAYIHDFEDLIGEAGGHVNYFLELSVRRRCPCEILNMGVGAVMSVCRRGGLRFYPFCDYVEGDEDCADGV